MLGYVRKANNFYLIGVDKNVRQKTKQSTTASTQSANNSWRFEEQTNATAKSLYYGRQEKITKLQLLKEYYNVRRKTKYTTSCPYKSEYYGWQACGASKPRND
jgi:hypothetical protein